MLTRHECVKVSRCRICTFRSYSRYLQYFHVGLCDKKHGRVWTENICVNVSGDLVRLLQAIMYALYAAEDRIAELLNEEGAEGRDSAALALLRILDRHVPASFSFFMVPCFDKP